MITKTMEEFKGININFSLLVSSRVDFMKWFNKIVVKISANIKLTV
jgi:hypothetical protein